MGAAALAAAGTAHAQSAAVPGPLAALNLALPPVDTGGASVDVEASVAAAVRKPKIPQPEPGGGALTIQIENDAFVPKASWITGTDRYYTHGTRIAWVSAGEPGGLIPKASSLAKVEQRWGWVLGQNIYTPEDIHRDDPDALDRPYAGWLYLGGMLISHTEKELNTVELDLGVVGPSALAEQSQNGIHHIRSLLPALGWAHQLKDEPAVLLAAERRWNSWSASTKPAGAGWGADLTPRVAAEFGNVQTAVSAGLGLRVGYDLVDDFGPPRIRPGPSGASFFNDGGTSDYLFLTGEVRAVGHDIFLDGNTFRHSHAVQRVPFGWEVEAGYVIRIGWARITYAYVRRSREFTNQKTPDEFASMSLAFVPRDVWNRIFRGK